MAHVKGFGKKQRLASLRKALELPKSAGTKRVKRELRDGRNAMRAEHFEQACQRLGIALPLFMNQSIRDKMLSGNRRLRDEMAKGMRK